jgi:hypothetical protein
MCRSRCDVQVNQAANGVISSCDVLADLLESIEHFVDRLIVYTAISPTPAIDKIVIDLIVGLISTLALVTRKLNQRRSREFSLADLLPYSAIRSQSGKELFWGQGHQECPPEAKPTDGRNVSEYHGSDSRACQPSRKKVGGR